MRAARLPRENTPSREPVPGPSASGGLAAPPSSRPQADLPVVGSVLEGKYRIDAYIGAGSMGAVARARHLGRDADVAIKLLTTAALASDGKLAERFRLEAIAASRLHTDHVVRVFDVADGRNGLPYLVMELLQGEDLDSLLVREGAMSVPRAVHMVLQALRALDVAHTAGVVHRDLKPGNLFVLARDGDPDFVKILDFGISKVDDDGAGSPRLTQGEMAMGTPLYMAPEQASDARTVTATADVYSAAAVLFECISGTPPLVADRSIELLFKLLKVTPPRLDALVPTVPQGLADAVAIALSKSPSERPPTAAAFAALLAPYADERSVRVLVALRLTPRFSYVPTPPAWDSSVASGAASGEPKSAERDASQLRLAPPEGRRSRADLEAMLLRRPPRSPLPPYDGTARTSSGSGPDLPAVDVRRSSAELRIPSPLPPSSQRSRPPVSVPVSADPRLTSSPPRRSSKPPPTSSSWAVVALISFVFVFIVGLAVLQLTGTWRGLDARPAGGSPTAPTVSLSPLGKLPVRS